MQACRSAGNCNGMTRSHAFCKCGFKFLDHGPAGEMIAAQHGGHGGDVVLLDAVAAVWDKVAHSSVGQQFGHALLIEPIGVGVAGIVEALGRWFASDIKVVLRFP